MAVFTNQATLSYSGGVTASNIVTGEIAQTLSARKIAVAQGYDAGAELAYVVTIVNSGEAAVTGVKVSDDLGAFQLDGATLYPLSYVDGSAVLLINGVEAASPTVTAGPPLQLTGIEIPAGGSAVLVYAARVTAYAPMGAGAEIVNTATISGAAIAEPLTASATVPMAAEAGLSITKSLSPEVVTGAGEVTYTFLIQNTGAAEAAAADNVAVTDTFSPALSGISAALNGEAMTAYTYNEATGAFATTPGAITVPAATFTRAADGAQNVTPGTAVLVVKGQLIVNS